MREGGLPVATGENFRTLWEFKQMIASGGVKGIGEIHVLALHSKDGVEGVITGRALYDGRLDLAAALSVAAAA